MNKEKSLSFESLLGELKMKGSMIITSDERYLTIVEISPINFDYKPENDKENIIDAFAQYTKIAPVKLQIKTLSRVVNANKYINVLNKDFIKEKNSNLIEYQEDYINLIKRLSVHSGISRRFFVVLEAVDNGSVKIKSIEDAAYFLDRAKDTLRKYLSSCGNSIIIHDNEAEFVLSTLFEFINKNKPLALLQERKHNALSLIINEFDNDEEMLDEFDLPIIPLIEPKMLKIYKDYCKVDDTYYSFLYIPSANYPMYVPSAWLSSLICGGEGIDIDVFYEKRDTKAIKRELRRKQRFNKARKSSMKNEEGENYEELINSLASTQFIRDKLSQGEQFFFTNILITISGDSFEEMNEKHKQVQDFLSSADIDTAECTYSIKETFLSYLPLNKIDVGLYNRSKRNVTTSGLSSFYPFTSYEVSDDDGILLGISESQTMIVADNFDTKKYSNANMIIFGSSGSGKTFTMQNMCTRFRLKGIQTFVITPDKGDEFERGCHALGGEFITLSSGSNSRINIFEIRPSDETNKLNIGFVSSEKKQSILSKKIDSLLTFFTMAIGPMAEEEKTQLDEAIIKTYEKKGITKDNNSLILKKETVICDDNTKTIVTYKKMPIIEDLWNELKSNKSTERLSKIVARFVTGSASAFNGQTNVDLANKYIVFDLTDLSSELRPLGMFVTLDYINDKAKQDKTKKKVIAIDELWMLITQNELAAGFVMNLFKVIRGFGGCALASTQNISDCFSFEDGKYGKPILDSCKIKMVLKLEDVEAKVIQEKLNLSYNEYKQITNLHRGQVLVKSNENTFSMSFKASRKETLMITTDRKILEKIANGETITDDDLVA